jgi:hypothetical protein
MSHPNGNNSDIRDQRTISLEELIIGEDWLIVRLVSLDENGRFFWFPLGYDKNTENTYQRYLEKFSGTTNPIAKELILASALL